MSKGVARPENQGGARNIARNQTRREAVQNHIQSFSCRASHYARRSAPGRKYLPTDLNVKKMHELFIQQNDEQVIYALYYSVFMYNFNLAFGHPAVDICSTCLKNPSITDQEKQELSAMYILHRRRARRFYECLNNVQDSFTVCFDIMENLVLPKCPIVLFPTALYACFCIVHHLGYNQPQGKDDIHLYVWMENQNTKDSNMVASALNHYFVNCGYFLIHVSGKI